MRVASNKPNKLRLHDNLSESVVELYFRTPTAKEQAQYTNGMTKRVRNKIINCTGENRQKFGKAILAGFRDNDFGYEGPDNQVVPVSSTPGHLDYREDWKEWFCQHNADLVDTLAIHAFEMTSDNDASEDLPDGDGDDTDPS